MEKTGERRILRPMAGAALGAACGVLLHLALPNLYCALLIPLLLLVCCILAKRRSLFLLLPLTMALVLVRAALLPNDRVTAGEYTLTGTIAETPEMVGTRERLVLRGAKLNNGKLEGRVELLLPAGEYEYGQSIRLNAAVEPAYSKTYSGYTGITAYASAKEAASILAADKGFLPYAWLLRLRTACERSLENQFHDNAALAKGLVLGDSGDMEEELYADFVRNGLIHLFAVSGLHVAILAALLERLLRFLSERKRFAVVAAFLLLYAGLTAFSPSVLRASVMYLILQAHGLVRRKSDPPTTLLTAFTLLLLLQPYALFRVGFQLSFGAALGLILLREPIKRILRLPAHPVFNALCSSLAVSVTLLTLLAYHFGEVSLAALPVSMLVLPCMSFVLGLTFLSMLAGLLFPAAGFLAALPNACLSALTALARGVDLPLLRLPSPPLYSIALWLIGLYLLSPVFLRGEKRKWFYGAACLASAALLWFL